MKGYIKIETTTHEGQEGFAVETHVQNLSTVDVIQVLDAVCQTLHVPNNLLQVFASLRCTGLLNEFRTTVPMECNEVSFDMEELMRQIKRGDDSEG